MSRIFMTKRKSVTAVVAVLLTVVIIFGGTFAWQSISQTALNEVSATVNPGGRLHDDFVDITFGADEIAAYDTMTFDKNVYVENFTSLADNGVQVFARIRLDEYMELGIGAGGLTDDGKLPSTNNKASSIVPGAKLEDKTTWTTHIPGKTNDPFHLYWDWSIGGQTTYMPTFNKDKTSLEADINGSFVNDFNDYVDYSNVTDTTDDDWTIMDDDGKPVKTDNAVYAVENADGTVDTITIEETHVVKDTINGHVTTMEEWLKNPVRGDFWVWDTDGWAYWANPIDPSTATGLLLTGINRTNEIINEDWYYGINVVAQFITKDAIGYEDGSGFYDDKDGSLPPTAEALLLLNEIGVDVTFEVDNADDLEEALAHGGNIILNNDVTIDTNLVVSADTTLDLRGHTISTTDNIYDEAAKVWSLISVRGADTTLTINGGSFTAKENDCFAIDVRDGAQVIINKGNFVGNISAVYVHTGSALINGGTFSILQPNTTAGEGAHDQMINAYNANYANGTADITICGGTFYGFNPNAANDGNFVPDGYEVSSSEGVYTVTKTVTE